METIEATKEATEEMKIVEINEPSVLIPRVEYENFLEWKKEEEAEDAWLSEKFDEAMKNLKEEDLVPAEEVYAKLEKKAALR